MQNRIMRRLRESGQPARASVTARASPVVFRIRKPGYYTDAGHDFTARRKCPRQTFMSGCLSNSVTNGSSDYAPRFALNSATPNSETDFDPSGVRSSGTNFEPGFEAILLQVFENGSP